MKSLPTWILDWSPVKRLACFLIAASVPLALWSAFARPFGHDEFEAIHTAWKMWSGERIYVDFFQHHHFLYYSVLGWLITLFGETTDMALAARGFSVLMAAGIVYLTYRIARLQFPEATALLAVALLLTAFIFLDKAIEVRPDVPQTLMGMLAVFAWLQYAATKRRSFLFLMAGSLFLSFLFLQKAVFLIALLGLFSLYLVVKRRMSVRDFTILWGVLGGLLISFGAFLFATGVWSEYLFLNWTVNTRLMNTFFPLKYLWFSASENPILWLAFLAGSGWLFWQRKPYFIGLIALGLLGTAFFSRTPFAQYFLLAMPFVAIVAAEALVTLLHVWRTGPVLAVIGLSAFYPAYLVMDEIGETNAGQLQKIEYVRSMTKPSDLVYDGDANFNLFRKDMDYFWFSVRPKKGVLSAYQSLRPYPYDPYVLIAKREPRLISDSFLKMKDPVIVENYIRSEHYRDLWIRK